MGTLFDTGVFSVVGLDGDVLPGAKLYWYEAGTSTPLATYADPALTVPNTNPVLANADGRFPQIWLQSEQYKYVLTDEDGVVLHTQDDYAPYDSALGGEQGASLIGTEGGGTVQDALDDLDAALVDSSRPTDTPALVRGLMVSSSSVFLLGDSITRATGASVYEKGFSWLTARSILNANDQGYSQNAGYGYHTIVNMTDAVDEANATLGGGASLTTGGVVNSRLTLPAGGYIEITGRQLASIDAIYDASASTGSLVFKLNGSTIATKSVSGSSYNNTFQTQLAAGANIASTDVVRIEATGGTIIVTGLLPLRQATGIPLVYVAGESGTGYQDYTDAASMDEIAYYMNLFRTGTSKVLLHALGTNNIYSVGKSLIPADMLIALSDLIAGIDARATDVTHIIQIPPRANEAIFPVIAPGYTYEDYVVALRNYARANDYGLIQQNLSGVENFLADGVHPNDGGHLIMAATVTESLGVEYNPAIKTLPPSTTSVTTGTITLGANWGLFGGIANSAKKDGNTVSGTGIIAPAVGATTSCAVLPASYRPVGRTCYFMGRSDAGAAPFSIDTSGNVVLGSVPASWFSLEGINFQIAQ